MYRIAKADAKAGLFLLGCLVVWLTILLVGCQKQEEKQLIYNTLMSMLDKQSNVTMYEMVFSETADNLTFEVVGRSDGKDYYVDITSPFEKRRAIKVGDHYYLCAGVVGKNVSYCSEVTNETLFSNEVNNLIGKLVTEENTKNMMKTLEVLHNASALTFLENITTKEIGDRVCTSFKFSPDYRKLTLVELLKIGMDPSSPLVTSVTNFTEELCLDNETGIPLMIHISYLDKGKQTELERVVKNIRISLSEGITPPEVLDNTTRFVKTYTEAKGLLRKYHECINSDNRDYCLKQAAYDFGNYRFCKFIGDPTKQDQCYVLAVVYEESTEPCSYVNDPFNKDVCYYEHVNNHGRKEVCNEISNASLREECLALNVTPAEKKIECHSDEDCHITGYYNQTCAPVNVTLDEEVDWEEIFECYDPSITSCICIDNRCEWDLTNELMDCIDRIESRQIYEEIKKSKINETNQTDQTEQENQTE